MVPDPMRVSLLLAHPNPGSFNHAIAETAAQTLQQNGHQVAFHDLYRRALIPFSPGKRSQSSARGFCNPEALP